MKAASRHLLRNTLRDLYAQRLSAIADWDLLIRQARRAGLLARLGFALEEAGATATAPREARQYLEAEVILAEKQARDVRWEVRCIKSALAGVGAPLVFLKGAAYTLSGLPAARGRLYSDIDIMVPIACLDAVEAALKRAGWGATEHDAYDERYYREWMHQIPPMTHFARWANIDVHHTIVARTARHRLNADKLFAAAVPMPGDPELKMLAPADMVLHSATHLLNEGEFDRGLRDLDDMHLLLRLFGVDPGFWPALVARAAELGLTRPLYYALRYTSRFLGTPVPETIRQSADLAPPGPALRAVMDRAFDRALRPDHASCRDALSPVALTMLYIRGHLLLMPPQMLLPHLTRKAVKRWQKDKGEVRPGLRNAH